MVLRGQPKPKPLTSVDYGRRSGLKLVIKKDIFALDDDNVEESNEFTKTVSNSDSIMVLLHHSMDFPGLNTNAYIVQKTTELEVGIKPELIKKPADLYHRNKANEVVAVCIANDKNILEYFPVYRYSNCYANCRVRAMIKLCGCLPFIYSHIAKFHQIDSCETDGLACIQMNSKRISIVRDVHNNNFTCSCRTPCDDVIYEGYPNSIALLKPELSASYKNVTANNALLRVFMQSQIYQITETLPAADEVYLLASIGGIFSLFLGCSFLSLVEILYFLGLICRAVFSRRRSGSAIGKGRLAHDNFANTRPSFS
ncbi:sodium channel protein Nach [Andrena cerasifolii]|uniref:sodium channel protein Nach n=1 Tax=Andrena cerasifolii TaxID=2819439 RepID=UPI0040382A2A